jgi:hypothetical protein
MRQTLALPYNPSHSEKWLLGFFEKGYYKKPYDRFMWWRSYTPKYKPLTNRHPLKDRILNGDFDVAPHRFEAELAEHRMNQKFVECRGYEDVYREAIQVEAARRKRLLQDYDKEEQRRLDDLKNSFIIHFKMSKEQYDMEVENTNAKDLIDFYFNMEEKYGTYWKPLTYPKKT